MVELRIDHLKIGEHERIREIITKSPLPVIATNRSTNDGGLFPISDEFERIYLLQSIINCRPAFVDVELEMNEESRSEVIHLARKNDVRVICSHHDFKRTPNIDRISTLAKKMSRMHPDIAKLVFTPRNKEDALRILTAAYKISNSGHRFTIFGMGQFGKLTRLTSLLFGGCLVYCSVKKNEYKLGQIGAEFASKYLEKANQLGWPRIRRNKRRLLRAVQNELRGNSVVDYNALQRIVLFDQKVL